MCGLISADFPVPEGLYGKEYFETYVEHAKTHKSKLICAHRWATTRRFMNGHTKVLDYGAGAGAFFAYPFVPPGLKLMGLDINPYSPYHLPAGSTVIRDMFQEAQVLTMFDVIEHIRSPRDIIAEVEPEVLVVLTPNVGAVDDPGKIAEWKHYKPGEHLHYYSVPSLSALFEKLGFRVKWYDFHEAEIRNPQRPRDLVTMVGVRE
jgi:hypothetical protein